MTPHPTVTVAVPVLDEERHIEACLGALAAQTYPAVVEVLVIDGGSRDATRSLVAGRPGVRLLENPGRIQSRALNVALAEARGEILVRVDGHCVVEPDYVERCVEALDRTGAAMVGGAMRPAGQGWLQCGIAAAMRSRVGAGPARFHTGGRSAWVDTVYLGAYRTDLARRVGGYAEDMVANEDAEFALRMGRFGGVWFDDAIRSRYTPRASLLGLGRQFYRYGRFRAATVRRHPRSLALRQLPAPLLVLALCTGHRREALTAYACLTLGRGALEWRDPAVAAAMTLALPAMHLPWGLGFLRGLLLPEHPAT